MSECTGQIFSQDKCHSNLINPFQSKCFQIGVQYFEHGICSHSRPYQNNKVYPNSDELFPGEEEERQRSFLLTSLNPNPKSELRPN